MAFQFEIDIIIPGNTDTLKEVYAFVWGFNYTVNEGTPVKPIWVALEAAIANLLPQDWVAEFRGIMAAEIEARKESMTAFAHTMVNRVVNMPPDQPTEPEGTNT